MKVMPKISLLRSKADKMMQQYYRLKNLSCEICSINAQVMHHFFPKSTSSSLRYNDSNLIPLCNGCHFAHHNGDPRIHVTIIQNRGIEWYKRLLKEKNEIIKINKEYYQEIIQKYGG